MALNIPNVGTNLEALLNGIKTGSGMYSNLMRPILEREKQEQAEKHFQEQLKLSKASAGRAAQAAADNHRLALNKLDPLFQAKQYEALENYFRSKSPQALQPSFDAPSQEMGEGLGLFTPEGMQEAQQQAQQMQQQAQQQSGMPAGIDLDLMRQSPMLRGFYKKAFGVDPLAPVAQTPEQKQAMAVDLFKQKENIRKENKGGDTPTDAVLTQNQQAIQGIDVVLPMLQEFVDHPEKVYDRFDFDRSKRAAYNAKTSGMIDTLIVAQQLPKVQASIDLVEQQVRRGTGEKKDAYIARIKDLMDDLKARRAKSQSLISTRKVNTSQNEDFSKMSNDELRAIIGGY